MHTYEYTRVCIHTCIHFLIRSSICHPLSSKEEAQKKWKSLRDGIYQKKREMKDTQRRGAEFVALTGSRNNQSFSHSHMKILRKSLIVTQFQFLDKTMKFSQITSFYSWVNPEPFSTSSLTQGNSKSNKTQILFIRTLHLTNFLKNSAKIMWPLRPRYVTNDLCPIKRDGRRCLWKRSSLPRSRCCCSCSCICSCRAW